MAILADVRGGIRPEVDGPGSLDAQQRQGRTLRQAAAYVGLTVASLVMFLPFYYMITIALQEKGSASVLNWPPPFAPHWPIQVSNFADVFTALPFARFFFNSGLIAVLSVSGTLLSSTIVAYAFARLRFRGRSTLFIAMLATLMVPPQVTLIPQFILFRSFQWYDTFYPLWVPHWTGSAFAIFLLRQYFMTLPVELEDAARMDGASAFRIYSQIFVPLSKPVLATIAVLVFLSSWNDLLLPVVYLSSEKNYTVPLGMAFFNDASGQVPDLIAVMAASILAVVPPILIFIFAQGYFVRGIVLTGLKG